MLHAQISRLVPDRREDGYGLIVIDPPWENASARRSGAYATLPSRHFLGIPVPQLAHPVSFWLTLPFTHNFFVKICHMSSRHHVSV